MRRSLLAASLLAISPRALLSGGGSDGCQPTARDYYGLGPFFKEGAPFREVIALPSEPGDRLFITGIVYANDCITPLRDIVIDIWHADDDGAYSSTTDPNDYRLRARLISNASGAFAFETIKPGLYLNGSQYRPSHIHLKSKPPGGVELVTQLYFEGDPYIPVDAAASRPDAASRIIPLVSNSQGLHGVFDLILNVPPPASGVEEREYTTAHLWLRQNHPNPVDGSTTIPYHLPKRSQVELAVFDMLGNRVRLLSRSTQGAGAYAVVWDGHDDTGARLPAGAYSCRLVAGGEVRTRVMMLQ